MESIRKVTNPFETLELLRGYGLSAFSYKEVLGELERLHAALGQGADAKSELMGDEWDEFIHRYLQTLGPLEAQTDTVNFFVDDSKYSERQTLSYRIAQAFQALSHCEDALGLHEDGTQGVLLLPVSYCRRIEVLLARGKLPIAMVKTVNVELFE